jgi:NADH-quinone oxidoreductase subunit E
MTCMKDRFDEVRKQYPPEMKSSLVLPLLYIMQEEKGHLTDSDAVFVADYIGVPAMQVKEALEWYTMFYKQPVGRHVVKVCRNISCSLLGAERLIEHVKKKLCIEPGQTTADGKFTLLLVECLASCGTAPMMQVNDTYHEALTEAKIDRILGDLS